MRRAPTWSLALALLPALAVAGGCAPGSTAETDSTYVFVMRGLRDVRERPGRDSARLAAARDSVLRAHGVTEESLLEMARRIARDPERAQELWVRIQFRPADTTNAR